MPACHFKITLCKPQRQCITIFFPYITAEHSLACYKCHSKISWEDCDNKMGGVNCSAGFDVCIKVERTWQDYTNNSTQLKTTYSRNCYLAEECTQSECREKNWKCKIDCCTTSLCNASTIMSLHALLTGVFLCFALEAISAFQKKNILNWKKKYKCE